MKELFALCVLYWVSEHFTGFFNFTAGLLNLLLVKRISLNSSRLLD